MQTTILSEEQAKSFKKKFSENTFVPIDDFVRWALYDSKIGYYRKSKVRVGKSSKTDFYTSSSFTEIWPRLIVESCINLIYPHSPSEYQFVEIAAEPNTSLLDNHPHPFSSSNVYRLGDEVEIPRRAIVYSNEWLDALPFKRFSFSKEQNHWLEHGVILRGQNIKEKKFYYTGRLPFEKVNQDIDGYVVDWSLEALEVLSKLASQSDWKGIFLTFDYGLSLQDMLTNRPEGTARSYRNHKMSNNIFVTPGDQDITCHICWDSIQNVLEQNFFDQVEIKSQESFLVKNARNTMKSIVNDGNQKEKSALKELVHPHYMGHKFQALSARRL